eukprot:5361700-Prymnesium_polylepis.1
MGQGLSTECGCIDALKRDTTRESWLQQRCEELAEQNEMLRQRLREVQPHHEPRVEKRRASDVGSIAGALTAPPVAGPPTPAVPPPHRDLSSPAWSRQDSRTDLAAMAIAAAAESTAEYQRSMVKVQIDNESMESATLVSVRAPNRRRLLADMSGALTGLGLLVIEASISTAANHAINRFVLQEANPNPSVKAGAGLDRGVR